MKGIFSTSIAIGVGIIVLLGYFLTIPVLVATQTIFIQWAIFLSGWVVLIGIINLIKVHGTKIMRNEKGSFYSVLLIISMLATFGVGLFFGTQSKYFTLLFNAIQSPVEASLMAILAVTLVYASMRLLRWRTDLTAIIFIVTTIVIMLGTAPVPFIGTLPIVSDLIRPVIAQIPAAGGARGILIGVALGTLMTGLRVMFGTDRPYGGK